jgi:hypothetical protein
MTALPSYLRKRPWLVPCLTMLFIGVSTMVTSRFGYLVFWAGVLLTVGGLLGVLTGYLSLKREKTVDREASG